MEEGVPLHLASSLAAGFVATAVSIPVDLAKTTLQAQKPLPDGTLEYKGSVDVLVKTVQKHGPLRLWRGFSKYNNTRESSATNQIFSQVHTSSD